MQTKVINCNIANKSCLLQPVHTKAIAASTQFCDFSIMRWISAVATLELLLFISDWTEPNLLFIQGHLLNYLNWTSYELNFIQRRAEDLVRPSSALACYLQLHGKRIFLQNKSEYLGQQLFDIDNCWRNIQVTLIRN